MFCKRLHPKMQGLSHEQRGSNKKRLYECFVCVSMQEDALIFRPSA